MKRVLLVVTSLLLLLAEGGPSQARPQGTPEPAPSGPASPPAAPSRDPLDEFVPHEKLEADSVVAFPVDI